MPRSFIVALPSPPSAVDYAPAVALSPCSAPEPIAAVDVGDNLGAHSAAFTPAFLALADNAKAQPPPVVVTATNEPAAAAPASAALAAPSPVTAVVAASAPSATAVFSPYYELPALSTISAGHILDTAEHAVGRFSLVVVVVVPCSRLFVRFAPQRCMAPLCCRLPSPTARFGVASTGEAFSSLRYTHALYRQTQR